MAEEVGTSRAKCFAKDSLETQNEIPGYIGTLNEHAPTRHKC